MLPYAAVIVLAALAFAFSALVTPAVIRLCLKYQALDRPNARKLHTRGIPRLGGAAVFVALSLGLTLAACSPIAGKLALATTELRLLPPIYLGLCGFFFIGFLDDLRSLPALIRLLAQCGVALAVVLLADGAISITSLFGWLLLPPWLSIALTVVWIVGIVNTFNWIDGLDGLSTGLAGISACAFLALAVLKPGLPNSALTITLCALLIGAAAGFMLFNFHPARIFIGDGGAFSLGYMLAVISVVGLFKKAAVITFLLPVLILALPISDTAFAIVRRLFRGQPLTQPDDRHIHHRLLALMSRSFRARLPERERTELSEHLQVNPAHRNAVLAMYAFAALFAAVAIIVGTKA